MTMTEHRPVPVAAPVPAPAPVPGLAAPLEERRRGLNTDTLALGAVFIAACAFVVALVAVGLAARAIDERGTVAPSSAPAPAATVALSEFAIEPATVTVPSGTAAISVTNDGAATHNLAVVDGSATAMLGAGESATLDVSGLAPGTYSLRCDVPGHEGAGMRGTLTVS